MESVFVLSGEVDHAAREANRYAAEEFWAPADAPIWIIDLTDVSFIDSSGFGLLIDFQRRAHERGASITLRRPSPAVSRWLTNMGLTPLFDVDPP